MLFKRKLPRITLRTCAIGNNIRTFTYFLAFFGNFCTQSAAPEQKHEQMRSVDILMKVLQVISQDCLTTSNWWRCVCTQSNLNSLFGVPARFFEPRSDRYNFLSRINTVVLLCDSDSQTQYHAEPIEFVLNRH
jgi:hypothetical protein